MKHCNLPCQIEITKVKSYDHTRYRANYKNNKINDTKVSHQCSSALERIRYNFEHVFELFRIQYIGNITQAILDRL